jgi:hypothetical protein
MDKELFDKREIAISELLSEHFDDLMAQDGITDHKEDSNRAYNVMMFEDAGDTYRFMGSTVAPGCVENKGQLAVMCDWPVSAGLAQYVGEKVKKAVQGAVEQFLKFRSTQDLFGGPKVMRELLENIPEGEDANSVIQKRLDELKIAASEPANDC